LRFSAIQVWVPITTVLYVYDVTDELLDAKLEDDGTEELELATELELGMDEEPLSVTFEDDETEELELATELELGMDEELLGVTFEDDETEEFELGITEELLGTTTLDEETTAELETTDELLAGGGDGDSLSEEQDKSNEA
jgi:hypothetical protein